MHEPAEAEKIQCVHLCRHESVRMTVLLADERRCDESAEEDRSPQSGGGAYRQAMKLKEKTLTDKSLAACTLQARHK